MKKVLVLMSSYNGERFIKEQINSILSQEEVDVHLLVRDDGSSDKTVCLLNEYVCRYPKQVDIILGNNVGYRNSFSALIEVAFEKFSNYDYFAFVDQDDTWHADKLKHAISHLDKYDENIPNLYCSNSFLINENGIKTGLFYSYIPRFTKGNTLFYPTLQGCSMVFNLAACKLYAEHKPEGAIHDRWMYYICSLLGNVFYDQEPRFNYRIHGNNQIGITPHYSLRAKLIRLYQMLFFNTSSSYYQEVEEFGEKFNGILSDHAQSLVDVYLSYPYKWSSKIKLIFSKEFGYKIPTFKEKSLHIIHVLRNKL